jgi:hypothetical protein
MSAGAQTMAKLAAMPDILRAAGVLERHGLLPKGETAAGVVKRYVAENPDIAKALAPNS